MVTIRIGIGMNMKKNMDESWKHWVKENMTLGIPKETIFNTLKSHNFDLDDITNTMGWSPEEGLFIVQDETSKTKKSIPNIVYSKSEIQHERRFIYKAEKIEVKDDVLDIYKINNFLSKKECEKNILKLKERGNIDLGVSLDGCKKESVESFKTGVNFDRVIRNMKLLKRI